MGIRDVDQTRAYTREVKGVEGGIWSIPINDSNGSIHPDTSIHGWIDVMFWNTAPQPSQQLDMYPKALPCCYAHPPPWADFEFLSSFGLALISIVGSRFIR